MYKLILLDDEKIVLQSMIKLIDFEEHGFILSGSYSSPLTALEEFSSIQPQLVITDIKMPQMDGLEFCSHVLRKQPDTDFVILSGYDDFTYAQTAVRLGVSDYMLKPVTKKDFICMLRKMYKKIDSRKHQASYVETLEKMVHHTYSEPSPNVLEKQLQPFSQNIMYAIDFVQNHYTENISLSDVASYAHLSKNYISDLFRKELNISFGGYLTSVRMEQAKKYLTETDMRMYEICTAVGYNDYAYFSTQFKKYTGKTLSEFRKGISS